MNVLHHLSRRLIGLIVGDGIQGLWKAVREHFSHVHRQRCWVHKMRIVLDT